MGGRGEEGAPDEEVIVFGVPYGISGRICKYLGFCSHISFGGWEDGGSGRPVCGPVGGLLEVTCFSGVSGLMS